MVSDTTDYSCVRNIVDSEHLNTASFVVDVNSERYRDSSVLANVDHPFYLARTLLKHHSRPLNYVAPPYQPTAWPRVSSGLVAMAIPDPTIFVLVGEWHKHDPDVDVAKSVTVVVGLDRSDHACLEKNISAEALVRSGLIAQLVTV